MPIKKAAFKHLRQTKHRTLRNVREKNRIKSLLKKTAKLVEAGKGQEAEASVRDAIRAIDKAVQHGILKKNAGARKKSRLIKRVRTHHPA